ncbi:MAG: hypothetical protein ACXVEF_30990 [Polyangiales bacterium]
MYRSISFLSLALLLSGSVACSSTTDNGGTATGDTGTGSDTSTGTTDSATDTKSDVNLGPEVLPGCAEDLATDYACPTFAPAAPSTACTEAMLQDLAVKCVKTDFSVGPDCAAWKAANAACSTCVEAWSFDMGKVYPDDYQCYDKIIPGCGGALSCELDCSDTVCSSCDMMSSEYDNCVTEATKSGGRCYDLASKKADTCRADTKAAPCDATQYYTSTPDLTKLQAEIVRLLRGACRDNGDWSKSDSAGGDAGTSDTGTDSGSATDSATDAGAGG